MDTSSMPVHLRRVLTLQLCTPTIVGRSDTLLPNCSESGGNDIYRVPVHLRQIRICRTAQMNQGVRTRETGHLQPLKNAHTPIRSRL